MTTKAEKKAAAELETAGPSHAQIIAALVFKYGREHERDLLTTQELRDAAERFSAIDTQATDEGMHIRCVPK